MEIQKINFINNIPVKNHNFHEPQDKNKYGFKLFMTSAFINQIYFLYFHNYSIICYIYYCKIFIYNI